MSRTTRSVTLSLKHETEARVEHIRVPDRENRTLSQMCDILMQEGLKVYEAKYGIVKK